MAVAAPAEAAVEAGAHADVEAQLLRRLPSIRPALLSSNLNRCWL